MRSALSDSTLCCGVTLLERCLGASCSRLTEGLPDNDDWPLLADAVNKKDCALPHLANRFVQATRICEHGPSIAC